MKRFSAILFSILMILTLAIPAFATDEYDGYTKISNSDELLAIADNPSGKYVLTADIDMSGVTWKPFAFTGVLDGNNHYILNLSVNTVSDESRKTYDGNLKVYDTYFAGLFSIIEGATVENVKLLNEKIDVTTELDCFVGGIAGYSDKSTIENCSVTGRLKLTVKDKMFGIAGIVGFGNGYVTKCDADVELVCIDNDKENRDEQFMGGILGDGYMYIKECNVTIKGYDSDHGYVHDGGLVGMCITYPKYFAVSDSYLKDNTVKGMITFFEDNTDRRAYCSAYVGEHMFWYSDETGNTDEFKRNETFDYSKNLLPCMCENPEYEKTVTDATADAFGYTTYTCKTCEYTYNDDYTIYQDKALILSPDDDSAATTVKENKNKTVYIVISAVAVAALIAVVTTVIVKKNKKKKTDTKSK